MYKCENANWLPMENIDLLDINGGSLLDTILGVGCLVVGGVAVVGAGVVGVYGLVSGTIAVTGPAAGELALAGTACLVAGAELLDK